MTNPCILLVDDDALNRYMLSEMLDILGYEVLEAADGHSAVRSAIDHAGKIDVILMDVHMPGLSGVDATSEIRGQPLHPPADTPILAVTADQAWVDAGRDQKSGFSGSISKPVILSDLQASLEALI